MRGRFEMGMFHDRTSLPKERELDQSLPPRTRLEKGGGGAIAGDLFSVWE